MLEKNVNCTGKGQASCAIRKTSPTESVVCDSAEVIDIKDEDIEEHSAIIQNYKDSVNWKHLHDGENTSVGLCDTQVCPHCKVFCSNEEQLLDHVAEVHNKACQIHCHMCMVSYTGVYCDVDMEIHMIQSHDLKTYKCNMCQFVTFDICFIVQHFSKKHVDLGGKATFYKLLSCIERPLCSCLLNSFRKKIFNISESDELTDKCVFNKIILIDICDSSKKSQEEVEVDFSFRKNHHSSSFVPNTEPHFEDLPVIASNGNTACAQELLLDKNCAVNGRSLISCDKNTFNMHSNKEMTLDETHFVRPRKYHLEHNICTAPQELVNFSEAAIKLSRTSVTGIINQSKANNSPGVVKSKRVLSSDFVSKACKTIKLTSVDSADAAPTTDIQMICEQLPDLLEKNVESKNTSDEDLVEADSIELNLSGCEEEAAVPQVENVVACSEWNSKDSVPPKHINTENKQKSGSNIEYTKYKNFDKPHENIDQTSESDSAASVDSFSQSPAAVMVTHNDNNEDSTSPTSAVTNSLSQDSSTQISNKFDYKSTIEQALIKKPSAGYQLDMSNLVSNETADEALSSEVMQKSTGQKRLCGVTAHGVQDPLEVQTSHEVQVYKELQVPTQILTLDLTDAPEISLRQNQTALFPCILKEENLMQVNSHDSGQLTVNNETFIEHIICDDVVSECDGRNVCESVISEMNVVNVCGGVGSKSDVMNGCGDVSSESSVNPSKKLPQIIKKRSKSPQQPCVYCFKTVYYLSRHLLTAHADRDEIKQIKLYSTSKKRKALAYLKRGGILKYNKRQASSGQNNFVCERRRPDQNDSKSSVMCIACNAFLGEKSFFRHKCPEKNIVRQNCVLLPTLGSAVTNAFYYNILSKMRNNQIATICKKDPLTFAIGLQYYKNMKVGKNGKEAFNQIKERMRRIASIMQETKQVAAESNKKIVLNSKDVFRVTNLNYVEAALKRMTTKNQETKHRLKVVLGYALKQALNALKSIYLEEDSWELKKLLKFEKAFNLRWRRCFNSHKRHIDFGAGTPIVK